MARLAAAAVLLAALSGLAAAAPLRIGGTGAAMSPVRMLAAEYAARVPGTTVEVLPSLGTAGGYKALAAGAIDLAVAARPPKPEEGAAEMVSVPWARTPLAFVVPAGSAADGVTLAQVADIYAGRLPSWPGGGRIRPVLRPVPDIEYAMVAALSPEVARALARATADPAAIIGITDSDAADALETIPDSFGTSSLALMVAERRRLKPLRLDGVEPTLDAIRDGRYPLVRSFVLALRVSGSEEGRRLVAWLREDERRERMAALGLLPH